MASTSNLRLGGWTPARTLACAFALALVAGCGGGAGEQGLGEEPDGSVDDGSVGDGSVFDVGPGGTCKPRTCAEVGANCGPVADGCGGLTENCGTCPAGTVCGGGGIPSVCGTTVGDGGGCVPLTCEAAGANCGPIGDGCGGVIECGTCPAGLSCGGGGEPSRCGVTHVAADGGTLGEGGTCIPKTCADYPGKNCGYLADGCGGVVHCGTCTVPGEICGATEPNVCGDPYADGGGCKPLTCADLGYECGKAGDGCGGEIDCGTCSAPYICGGVEPSKCGNPYADDAGVVCKPKTCADYGANCGPVADGCGGVVHCGTCSAPYICGGVEPNKCGNPYADDAGVVCKKRTCADYGAECGLAGDGCGDIIDCGTCTKPGETCGGGGIPSKCGSGAVLPGCTDPLCSKIPACDAGETIITGIVRAPNGKEPLPNAVVYIPKGGDPEPFPSTVSCDRCDTPKPALASAVTGPDGRFTLKGALPAGSSIPLVIELGRWRRYVTIDVTPCGTTDLEATTALKDKTRLPRWQREGHPLDNIPQMAIATGRVDGLECVLRKIGIDDREFTPPTGSGRVHMYLGGGSGGAKHKDGSPNESSLWASDAKLANYDVILFPCQGDEYYGSRGNSTTWNNLWNRLKTYTAAGGRIFTTHYSYVYLHGNPKSGGGWNYGPGPWESVATWKTEQSNPADQDAIVNTSFPKGADFATWLVNVGASTTYGKMPVKVVRRDVDAVNESQSTRWMSAANPAGVPLHFTFNTPVGVSEASQCGRVVFSDFHIANASNSNVTFPNECDNNAMTPQEKLVEYMLFDLTSCVKGDNLPPPEPPPVCKGKTCAEMGLECGPANDGCGVTLDCGTCTKPGETCGGAGVPGKCGGPKCTPKSCTDLGYECGKAGDGCGNEIDCGVCTKPGETCGGAGVPHKCGGPTCTPKSCADYGATCGYVANGCGSSTYCGDCTVPGETCGGGGVPGKCGSPECKPLTCADVGATCGWVGDGCGDKIYCGDCVAPETCGGAGIPGVCGKPGTTPCVPRTCEEIGAKCGPAGDGCGNLLDCGKCVAPETCGGGGVPGECGAPTCTPKTCAEIGFECGLAADGCGDVLNCGTCEAPKTCGGGGVPNKCGGGGPR